MLVWLSLWSSAGAIAKAEERGGISQLEHTPVVEQLVLTAIPIFVARSDERVASVHIAYRSFGTLPKSFALSESDDGFSFLIPCGEVVEPRLEYLLWALDAEGNTIASFGSVANPSEVRVVQRRTLPPPALPGALPPVQCFVGSVCTPGTLGCSEPVLESSLGQMCRRDKPCAEGLTCEQGRCALAQRSADSEKAPQYTSRFSVEVSAGVALNFLGSKQSPDSLPPLATVNALRDRDATEREAHQTLFDAGWDCQVEKAPGVLDARDCNVALQRPGVAVVPLLQLVFGIRLSSRVTLSPTARIQLRRGEGPLAGIALGVRAEYLLTTPKVQGLRVSGLAGAALGSMQASPRNPEKVHGIRFASSAHIDALGVVAHVGLRALYRWTRHLGLSLTTALQLGLPNAMFALDTVAGTEVYF